MSTWFCLCRARFIPLVGFATIHDAHNHRCANNLDGWKIQRFEGGEYIDIAPWEDPNDELTSVEGLAS